MSSLQFQYEIPAEEFVASQHLYHKLCGSVPAYQRGAFWIVLGAALVLVVVNVNPSSLPTRDISAVPLIIVFALGVSWIYGGIRILLPSRYFRRGYGPSKLAGKSYRAEVNEDGFRVAGDFCEWNVEWPGVQLKGEDERVFILYAANTIFIFGKKFLSREQQEELRRLSGLKS